MIVPLAIRKTLSDFYKSGNSGRLAVSAACELYIRGRKALGLNRPFKDNNPLVIVCHEYKFLFIGIPKVASQTFLNSLYFDKKIKRAFKTELLEKRPTAQNAFANYPDYYSFSLVRNPWARALSCYNSKIANPDPVKRARILSLYKGIKPGMSFLDFTRWLLTDDGSDDISDRHWLSQHLMLRDKNGDIKCTQIGNIETLHDDLQIMFRDSGIKAFDLRMRAFESGASNYRTFYCDEARSNIAKRYKEDITLFGYQF